MPDVYIALGSNLDRPLLQLQRALIALSHLPRSRLLAVSGFYRNAGIGTRNQSQYVNAVARLNTRLNPHELLERLQQIEKRHGRRKTAGRRWEPRALDLDLILYGQQQIATRRLDVPHRLTTQRDFVMLPLAEIAPAGLTIPGAGEVATLAAAFDPTRMQKLSHVR